MADNAGVLGERAVWGSVGYAGDAHAPVADTYRGIDALGLAYTTVEDSGDYPLPGEGSPLANLRPLVMAAMYEVGFAWEAGPLTTWSN